MIKARTTRAILGKPTWRAGIESVAAPSAAGREATREHGRGLAALIGGDYQKARHHLELSLQQHLAAQTADVPTLLLENLCDAYEKLGELERAEELCLNSLMTVRSENLALVWQRRLVGIYKTWGRLVECRYFQEKVRSY